MAAGPGDGGSGGGTSGYNAAPAVSTQPAPGFGNDGGVQTASYGSGGGGGAGAVGTSRGTTNGGLGGDGLSVATIIGQGYGDTGHFAGGGGGSKFSGAHGTGGIGGGGDAGTTGSAGTVNLGGGGGGAGPSAAASGAGGSGVVFIRVSPAVTATFSGGVTQTSATYDGDTVYAVTATSTTSETVTFS